MGHYDKGKYIYTFEDVGSGVCDEETYVKQKQDEQKKIDQDNAGHVSGPESPLFDTE